MGKYEPFERDPQRKHDIWDTILLKYSLNGESKFGTIKLNLSYNFDKDELDYLSIEYSDNDIKSFVNKNPSLLTKIESLRYKNEK